MNSSPPDARPPRRPAYYNEIDAFCCDVLRARIADGSLPPGDVDERDVRLVHAADLRGYGQIHLFAGIGGGALACRLAGVPDDFRIITAGVPCQPSSQAGKRLGSADERWLWPEFFRLLGGLGSHYALVEQPPGILSLNDGAEWTDILCTLVEVRAMGEWAPVSGEDVGAPQERERVWIVAYPNARGRVARGESERTQLEGASGNVAPRCDEGMGDASDLGRERSAAAGWEAEHGAEYARNRMGDAGGAGWEEHDSSAEPGQSRHAAGERARVGAWADAVPVRGYDGTVRLIPREAAEAGPESPFWPVAAGLPGRVARLRAIGNAWIPQAAVPALRVILAHAARAGVL